MDHGNIIVFDLEWNQGNAVREMQDPAMPFEIIEIGAVRYRDGASFSRLVRPTRYSTMHYVTGKLLHITMDMLKDEQTFPEVFREFEEWCGENPVFATWGSLDLTELQRNMVFHGMKALSDGPFRYYDVQKMYGRFIGDKNARLSLENAVDRTGMGKPFPFHRAVDDSFYTTEILKELPDDLYEYFSLDCYTLPKDKAHEIHVRYETYVKYISREFADRQLALGDPEVRDLTCSVCGSRLSQKKKWFSTNGKQYYTFGQCRDHGYIKGKVRLKKAEDGGTYVVKTMRPITKEEVEELLLKEQKAAKYLKKKTAFGPEAALSPNPAAGSGSSPVTAEVSAAASEK